MGDYDRTRYPCFKPCEFDLNPLSFRYFDRIDRKGSIPMTAKNLDCSFARRVLPLAVRLRSMNAFRRIHVRWVVGGWHMLAGNTRPSGGDCMQSIRNTCRISRRPRTPIRAVDVAYGTLYLQQVRVSPRSLRRVAGLGVWNSGATFGRPGPSTARAFISIHTASADTANLQARANNLELDTKAQKAHADTPRTYLAFDPANSGTLGTGDAGRAWSAGDSGGISPLRMVRQFPARKSRSA